MTNGEAIRQWNLDRRVGRCVNEGAKGADWTNYNRSLKQPL